MKVRLERSGGFAGLRRAFEADTAVLDSARAAELAHLVEQANLKTIAALPGPRVGKPDRFVYRLTVEDEAGARTVTVGEDTASPELQRLFDWLQGTGHA